MFRELFNHNISHDNKRKQESLCYFVDEHIGESRADSSQGCKYPCTSTIEEVTSSWAFS